ncbi:MAG: S26 family signal peptidase [Aeoliella sp.]
MKRPYNSSRWRSVLPWLRTGIVFALLITLVETFLVFGIVTPVVIEGSSMAPALLGQHAEATCPRCSWKFAIGGDQLPGDRPIVCPDCRESFWQEHPLVLQPGRRLCVDRTRYAFRPPRRWEVVVFRCPERASQLCVKRVLGLSGERLSFAAGDLLVDGHVIRKSIDEQLQIRQLVHRERDLLRYWRAEDNSWQWGANAWQHTGEAQTMLQFQPVSGPVTDDLGINQRTTRPLHKATDLMVTCEASLTPGARLEFRAIFPNQRRGKATSATGYRTTIVWSLFDRQAMLAVDGKVVWTETTPAAWPDQPRLMITATGEVTLHDLTVWRDAYYHTRPVDRHPAGHMSLAADEFFVVGDNVAISDDSRSWSQPGLPERLIIGAPLVSGPSN